MIRSMLTLALITLLGCNKPADLEVSEDFVTVEVDEGFNPPSCGYEVGDVACDLELTNSQGETVSLYDFKDNAIVLDFSTAWCYYCQAAAFESQQIQDMHESKGFTYIIVLIEDFNREEPSAEFLREWEDHFNITSVQILSGNRSLIDLAAVNGWFIEAYPTFYYIDRDMVITDYQRGFSSAGVNAMIESLLSE